MRYLDESLFHCQQPDKVMRCHFSHPYQYINHRQGVQCIDFYLSILLKKKKKKVWGNSLAVQWLGLSAFTEVALVQSLVGELRSPKPWGIAKKK